MLQAKRQHPHHLIIHYIEIIFNITISSCFAYIDPLVLKQYVFTFSATVQEKQQVLQPDRIGRLFLPFNTTHRSIF